MIIIKKKDWRQSSQILIYSAIVSVLLSAIGFTGTDIILASTQWLLISAVLALFAIYAKLNS